MATCYRSPPCRSSALSPSRCSRHSSRSRPPGGRRSSWSSRSCSAPSAARPTRGPMPTTTATSITSSRSAAGRIGSIATTKARFAMSRRRSASPTTSGDARRGVGRLRRRRRSPISIIGFADPKIPAKVYRNDAKGTKFVDVAKADRRRAERRRAAAGVDRLRRRRRSRSVRGVSRCAESPAAKRSRHVRRRHRGDRASAIRARPSAPCGGTSIATAISICSPRTRKARRTASIARTSGKFEDVAAAMGVAGMPRPTADGGVGPSVADFDLDGDFDLFVANYGHSALYRNDGGLKFTEVSRERGIDLNGHGVTSGWGDLDNDGLPDLYVAQLHRRPAAVSRRAVHQRREGVRRVAAGRDPQARCDARRAVRRLRSGRPARSGADQQRSRRRRPSAAAQHRARCVADRLRWK